MPSGLKKKFDLILSREQRLARAIALKAIRPKPLSVWEVMVPVIFIMGYMRAKADREVFSQNMLFTKKLALEAALDMIRKETSQADALVKIEHKTKDLLSSVPDGIYSEEIRREQLKEIELLIAHFCRLIQAQGKDYAALVVHAYQSLDGYRRFNDQLAAAESAVTQAARRTLGHKTDEEMAAKIELAAERLRRQEAETIFNSTPRR
jgi:hypothetical protein